MSTPDKLPYAQFHYKLIELGLSRTLVVLYGVLKDMVGENIDCWATHAKLAKKIGLKVMKTKKDQKERSRHIQYLLHQLRALKLIDWTRSRNFNRYRVLVPDVQWIAHQMRNGLHISDTQWGAHRTKSVSQPSQRTKPLSQSVSQTTTGAASSDGLADILTRTWNHLPGRPSAVLLGRIAAILGNDIRLDEYQALLANRRHKATSFGLALSLASELGDRRNGDDAAERDRRAANDAEQIRTLESLRDDPHTPASERAQIESMLNDLHKTSNRAAKGMND